MKPYTIILTHNGKVVESKEVEIILDEHIYRRISKVVESEFGIDVSIVSINYVKREPFKITIEIKDEHMLELTMKKREERLLELGI